MTVLLGLLYWTMCASDIFDSGFNIAPGLSLKNALLYSGVGILVLQASMGRLPRPPSSTVQVCFIVLLVYALLSMSALTINGDFPRYTVQAAIMTMKSTLVDWLLLFFLTIYGVRDVASAKKVMAVLLIAVGVTNAITLWNALHLPRIGRYIWNIDNPNRVDGLFGHANETGSMIATLLPMYVVTMLEKRGWQRLMWGGLLAVSVFVLVATLSRGATVGLLLGMVLTALICRRYIAFGRTARYALVAAIVLLPLLFLAGDNYLDALINRFTRVDTVSASDVSSGRTIIWGQAFDVMSRRLWYIFAGVGWNSWSYTGIRLQPHNEYLAIYFELGVIGLVAFVAMFFTVMREALRTLPVVDASQRAVPLAAVCSVFVLLICMMTSHLGIPWHFLWPYFALLLHLMIASRPAATASTARGAAAPTRTRPQTMLPARGARSATNAH